MAFQSSKAGGSATEVHGINSNVTCALMHPSCNENSYLGFPQGQLHSSISLPLPNLNGETSATDYQDCGLSSMFLKGEFPWESNLEGTCRQARAKAKLRYNEKKKTRRYVSSTFLMYHVFYGIESTGSKHSFLISYVQVW